MRKFQARFVGRTMFPSQPAPVDSAPERRGIHTPVYPHGCRSRILAQALPIRVARVVQSRSRGSTSNNYHQESKGSRGSEQSSENIKGLALCSAGLAFTFWSEDKKETIEKMIARALIAERENRLGDAEKFFHRAITMCRQENNKQALAYTYDQMADFNLRHGRLIKAESLFKDTLQVLLETGLPQGDPAVVEISLKLATIFERMGRNEDAELGYSWCIEMSEKLLKDTPKDPTDESRDAITNIKALLGMCMENFARFLTTRNRLAEAEQYYKKALKICEEDLQEDDVSHPQTLVLLNDLGTVCDMRGHFDEAEGYMQRALLLAEKDSPSMVPTILCNLASVNMHKGRKEDARALYQRALRIAEKSGDREAALVIRANLQKVS
ncbi:tetratricopeptide repeat protein 19, mitochondrial-like [Diadema setosum]|uniref:tetratricopeptide repeat protein 19, mitochondrial-like n=1 Tax=Diadema setosum TaxID=31175 RepID=UPI003B3B6655